MKEENKNGKGPEMTEDQIDFRALLFKYIIHWPDRKSTRLNSSHIL